jgi:hypothetical protein
MRRGESKAKSRKRGGRIRSAPAKAKARAGHKDASSASLARKLADKTRELSETLQQQAATSEVLRVISNSPGDLQPVFETMLEQAIRVCGAKFGTLLQYEGDNRFRVTSTYGVPSVFAEARKQTPTVDAPSPTWGLGQLAASKQVVHHDDLKKEWVHAGNPEAARTVIELGGARTFLGVPMLKGGELVGALGIYRQEVRPFTHKQIELVENFAQQAVIAIENARLLKELRQRTADLTESLEQQTATSEVLKVISSVPGALEPVFSAMLENATRICDARFGTLFRFDGELFHRVASTGTPSALVEFGQQRGPFNKSGSASSLAQVVATKTTVHVTDGREDANEAETPPVKLGGARSLVAFQCLRTANLSARS